MLVILISTSNQVGPVARDPKSPRVKTSEPDWETGMQAPLPVHRVSLVPGRETSLATGNTSRAPPVADSWAAESDEGDLLATLRESSYLELPRSCEEQSVPSTRVCPHRHTPEECPPRLVNAAQQLQPSKN